jgi:O-methyltransferase
VISWLRRLVRTLGVDVVRFPPPALPPSLPPDVSGAERAILARVAPYTMTSVERQVALVRSVAHVVRAGIQGSIVECGVWRGGSSMASALALLEAGDTTRDLWLYDTFNGMTAPTGMDRAFDGALASDLMARDADPAGVRAFATLADVRANLASTGYPAERLHFVAGPVEQTLPAQAPTGPIALLRLDTDWYESTAHELVHLWPRLERGGVLILDDYGHWEGAQRAVDEYFGGMPTTYLLQRIDYTGRMIIK